LKSRVEYLLSPQAIRERTSRIYDYVAQGRSPFFALDQAKLGDVAQFVAEVTRKQYPDLQIPYHGRISHLNAGGINRTAALKKRGKDLGHHAKDSSDALFELVIVSVLLDAGAGNAWRYQEADGNVYNRSEGLAVASYHMFAAGAFSSDPKHPMQVDGEALRKLTPEVLAHHFQVSVSNPLEGLEGRVNLLKQLGDVLVRTKAWNDGAPYRLRGLFKQILTKTKANHVAAADILKVLLIELGSMWPSRLQLDNVPLGDTWRHPACKTEDPTSGLVPFHKLTQWLTYSLIEPIELSGIAVDDLDSLTGLAEYRNGGLLIDKELLTVKDPQILQKAYAPNEEIIVEWRAMTVTLIDLLAPLVRESLGMSAAELPLVKILEGGTWRAGRVIASEKRPDGRPPISIISDGTVF
jgi:hypothetical protein